MAQLIASYDATFASSHIVNLRVRHQKNNKTLYWRRSGSNGNQPYIRLFQTEFGFELLSRLSPTVLSVLRNYEEKRLLINWRFATFSGLVEATQTLIGNIEAFQTTEQRLL